MSFKDKVLKYKANILNIKELREKHPWALSLKKIDKRIPDNEKQNKEFKDVGEMVVSSNSIRT